MKIVFFGIIVANLAIFVQSSDFDHRAPQTDAAEVDIERYEEEWLKYVGHGAVYTPDTFMKAMNKSGEKALERTDYKMYLWNKRKTVLMYHNLKRCRKMSR